jgi:lipopolysaccharide/colanic/teichoic acid biosynthesis glycosyltransferase
MNNKEFTISNMQDNLFNQNLKRLYTYKKDRLFKKQISIIVSIFLIVLVMIIFLLSTIYYFSNDKNLNLIYIVYLSSFLEFIIIFIFLIFNVIY